jgi:hypothetical protein
MPSSYNVLDIKGSTDAIAQGIKLSFTNVSGEEQILTYKGNSVAVQALYNTFKSLVNNYAAYDSVEFDQGKGNGTLIAKLIADGPGTFELYANEMVLPLELAPDFSALKAYEILESKIAVSKGISPTDFDANYDPTTIESLYYKYLCSGMVEYNFSSYVIRSSQIVSRRSQVRADFANVNKVVALPNGLESSLAIITGVAALGGEWLKKSPHVQTIGTKKYQVSYELWWSDKWPKIPYGGSWEPQS